MGEVKGTQQAAARRGSATLDVELPNARRHLTAEWTRRGIDVDALSLNRRGSIIPSPQGWDRRVTLEEDTIPVHRLPRLVGKRGAPGQVVIERKLAEGGMGVVSLAAQPALRRAVAVKTVRPDVDQELASQQLLREAWVTGILEHPNVAPVHALGRDDDGQPVMVMKYVEGTPWKDLLDEPARRRPGNREASALEWHLGVFKQVCNAIEFAHDKGILHRDLKPENVMVGDYGEVTVLDWGIAVTLRSDAPAPIPRAWDVTAVAGTPGYMAPEMVIAEGRQLSERTDVYQLGAILHEIATGEQRHTGEDVVEQLASAYASNPPVYGADVPVELAHICREAMAADPAERYPSVGALRRAIDVFLSHLSSLSLTEEAAARLETLEGLVRGPESQSDSARSAIYGLFNGCRFGFEQALRMYSENARAADGLQHALELMIDYELRKGATSAARALLEELPTPQPALQRRVGLLSAASQHTVDELGRLRHLEREHDPHLGLKIRSRLALAFGVAWALIHFGSGWAIRSGYYPVGYHEYLAFVMLYGMSIGVVAYTWRDVMLRNVVNRRIVGSMVTSFIGALFLVPIAMVMQLGFRQMLPFVALVSFMAGATLTVGVDRRLIWNPFAWLVGFVVAAMWPEYAFEALGTAGLASFVATSVVWAGTLDLLELDPD